MSGYQYQDKNRIMCAAKIRNIEPQINYQNDLGVQSQLKCISTQFMSKTVQPLDSTLSVQEIDVRNGFTAFEKTKGFKVTADFFMQQQETIILCEGLQECSRWEKNQTQSLFSRDDFTKQSEITDFTQFQGNLLTSNEFDNSFDQKYLSNNSYETPLHCLMKSSGDVTRLERTLEYKNVQFINALVTKNQQKKDLEKKIMDLQFKLFLQKKTNDKTINSIAVSLKNSEELCENQQNQIKRLQSELKVSQQLRQKVQKSLEEKILLLIGNIHGLQLNCEQLKKQCYDSITQIQALKLQKLDLLNVIKQLQVNNSSHEDIIKSQQKLTSDSSFQNIISNKQDNEKETLQQNLSDNYDSESEQNQLAYLQNLVQQYQKQLGDNRRKIRQQKKTINNLHIQLQQFQGTSYSLQVVNNILSEVNQEMMKLQLSKLNLQF